MASSMWLNVKPNLEVVVIQNEGASVLCLYLVSVVGIDFCLSKQLGMEVVDQTANLSTGANVSLQKRSMKILFTNINDNFV